MSKLEQFPVQINDNKVKGFDSEELYEKRPDGTETNRRYKYGEGFFSKKDKKIGLKGESLEKQRDKYIDQAIDEVINDSSARKRIRIECQSNNGDKYFLKAFMLEVKKKLFKHHGVDIKVKSALDYRLGYFEETPGYKELDVEYPDHSIEDVIKRRRTSNIESFILSGIKYKEF